MEWANPAFTRSCGYPLAECLGKNPRELVRSGKHPREFFQEMWQTILAGKVWHGELTNQRRDGSIYQEETTITPLFDGENKITHFVAIKQDITNRKRMEEELRQAGERTQFYMNRIPLAFIAWNRDFRVTEWNPAAEQIFGWSANEALGRHAHELIVPPDIQPLVNQIWQEVISGGNLTSHSVNENLTKDKRRITCEWRNAPWRDADGQICGCLSIVENITERIASDKQRSELEVQLRQSQKMEAIGQLSGGIAHDFNNILTVIQGNAALLQNLDLEPTETRDCCNQISRAAERAASLTRQLLMFARKQQMQPANLDLNETVAQITKMLQRILGEDITLRTEYAPALPLIHADIGMVEQIILNLAVNARDAMAGGGKLTLRTSSGRRPDKNGGEESFVCLHSIDTGCGIPPEVLPRIFEPFFTTKEVGKGTGLGLATVYGIVQQHHGDIRVESEPGKGTTFTVTFPALATTEIPRAAAAVKPVLPWGTETILLVEDELPLRSFVSDLLQRCGYTVLEAESGPAALKIWQASRDKIQLLFTDVIMPEDMNGIELGHRLQSEKPGLKIIYTSGYTGNVEGRNHPLVEGANFIRKPFKPEALARIIRASL
ncbi:MAG: PAS domain S-box protein, partial [Chthoniobacteraceae bacterium]